ncbi:MAG TPA: oligosaccharide flippase family protein, partial [bacterium]|nr:oligosaccharide flippase family protein [bacterium]
MADTSLKEKTVSGVAWAAVDQFSNQFVLFMVSVFIARILSPEDYGVIAIVMIFVSLSAILVNSGFGTAVIQRREISPELCSSVFFFNVTVSVLLYIALYLASPLIASFFDMPVLASVLPLLGIVIIINATYLMQVSLLTRELDFKKQSFVHLTATLVSGSIGLSMAYAGYGVWSLVAQSLSNSLTTSIAYWI